MDGAQAQADGPSGLIGLEYLEQGRDRVETTIEKWLATERYEVASGWVEPGQRPDFDEYTVVLEGVVRVEHEGGVLAVGAGQAVFVRGGEWVRYSTPQGASYVAVCLPAFSPDTVHRDND